MSRIRRFGSRIKDATMVAARAIVLAFFLWMALKAPGPLLGLALFVGMMTR